MSQHFFCAAAVFVYKRNVQTNALQDCKPMTSFIANVCLLYVTTEQSCLPWLNLAYFSAVLSTVQPIAMRTEFISDKADVTETEEP